jgi:hypothetical protein
MRRVPLSSLTLHGLTLHGGRRLATLGALLTGLLATAPAAYSDADPASDVLLSQDVYYPYSPPVSRPLSRQLSGLVAVAKQRGFPLKVALIGTPNDLGGVPHFFGQPQEYAAFLGQELSMPNKPELLVAMPNGYGLFGVPPPAAASLRDLPAPAGRGDALARQAIVAVPRIARAAGYEVPAPKPVAGSRSTGLQSAVLIALPVLIVVLAGGALALVNRRRRASSQDESPAS